MECEKSVMYKVFDKIKEMGFKNLKMICNDVIEFNEYFKDKEIFRIYLNFLDFWFKKCYVKRCLMYYIYFVLYK